MSESPFPVMTEFELRNGGWRLSVDVGDKLRIWHHASNTYSCVGPVSELDDLMGMLRALEQIRAHNRMLVPLLGAYPIPRETP